MRSLRETIIDLIETILAGEVDQDTRARLEDLLQELYDGDV